MKKSFTVHDLPQEERPRERMQQLGPEVLTSQEILALILGRGIKGESVLDTAHHLLKKFGSIQAMAEASLEELTHINGIGLAKAAQLKACFEIARRLHNYSQVSDKIAQIKVKSLLNLVPYIQKEIAHHHKEHFVVLSLDTRLKLIALDKIFIGTLNASLVHPRETFEAAIRRHAASIIVAHNHPSGDPEPSDQDIALTQTLQNSGKLLHIHLLDHIIVTKKDFVSLREKGYLL